MSNTYYYVIQCVPTKGMRWRNLFDLHQVTDEAAACAFIGTSLQYRNALRMYRKHTDGSREWVGPSLDAR